MEKAMEDIVFEIEKDDGYAIAQCKAMASMYNDNILTDFAIHLQGKTINCHRTIMYSRSEYFKTLFTSDFSDSNTREIDMDFLDKRCVEAIICLVHCMCGFNSK